MPANLPSSAQALVPFTGYYPLSQVAGAFVTIDTNMMLNGTTASYQATVTISVDGQNSTTYTSDACRFDGNTLVITGQVGPVASLVFTAAAGGMEMSGTITGYAGEAHAVSPFAPVDISVWYGTYYAQKAPTGQPPHYDFYPVLEVKADEQGNPSVWWTDGTVPMQLITGFAYDFAMFVIAFTPKNHGEVMFEMGTAAGWGRVAGNAKGGQLLVSIQQQVAVKNL